MKQRFEEKRLTYQSWSSMMGRCYRKNNNRYYCYGGRGIKVCRRWHKFENFYKDMGKKIPGLQLDRIDNNGDYKKSNCRWVTAKENSRNRNRGVKLMYEGKTRTLAEISEMTGVCIKKMYYRIVYAGWPIELAVINDP